MHPELQRGVHPGAIHCRQAGHRGQLCKIYPRPSRRKLRFLQLPILFCKKVKLSQLRREGPAGLGATTSINVSSRLSALEKRTVVAMGKFLEALDSRL